MKPCILDADLSKFCFAANKVGLNSLLNINLAVATSCLMYIDACD